MRTPNWYRVLFLFTMITGCSASAAPVDSTPHPLQFMFGEWIGQATVTNRDGSQLTLTQTERVGPMLGGDIVVIEGRGYAANGQLSFSAFAIASPTGKDGQWEMRSYTRGHGGTYPFAPRPDGFVWSTPAGPNARMRYTARIHDGGWAQTGEFVMPGQPPRKVFEMNLKRRGPTSWPAAGAVTMAD